MKYMWLIIVLVVAILFIILLYIKFRKTNPNVIKMSKAKNDKYTKQKCSYCKNVDKLTFYASYNGFVVGVCKGCKPRAERQDMLPL